MPVNAAQLSCDNRTKICSTILEPNAFVTRSIQVGKLLAPGQSRVLKGVIQMDWDQIESKWAAMALRVRGECSTIKVNAVGAPQRRLANANATANISADLSSTVVADEKTTMSAQ